MPIISVIVPVYKTEKYIDRCLESIMRQTMKDLEVILIDDGSPDNSGIICDEWAKRDSRIKVIHQKNAGAGAARNVGLKAATGEYIGFVDSDDWIHPQMYSILYKAIEEKKCDMAMCELSRHNRFIEKYPEIAGYPITFKSKNEMLARFFRINGEDSSIIQLGTKLIRKEILRNFQFIEGTINEDVSAVYDFISCSSLTASIPIPMYYYFINTLGVTRSPVTLKDMEYIHAFQKIKEDVKHKYPDFECYAEDNCVRSVFTILSKMKLFGFDRADKTLYGKYIDMKNYVRHNFWKLLRLPMPISRKLLLLYVCI